MVDVTLTIPAAVGEGTATPKISDYLKPPVFRSPALLVEETKKLLNLTSAWSYFQKMHQTKPLSLARIKMPGKAMIS